MDNGDYLQSTCSYRPKDRFNIVYIAFTLGGVATISPWNFFATASVYFQQKLKNDSLPDGEDPLAPKNMTPEQIFFVNYLALCSMLAMSLVSASNLFLIRYTKPSSRFLFGNSCIVVIYVVTIALVRINISNSTFLAITLVSVIIINLGAAVLQGAVLGTVTAFPAKYMKAFLEGQAVSGVLASVTSIVTIAAASDPYTSAFAYFFIAVILSLVSSIMFIVLRFNFFFKYYWERSESSMKELILPHGDDDLSTTSIVSSDPETSPTDVSVVFPKQNSNRAIPSWSSLVVSLWSVFLHGCCVASVFIVTLSAFPAMLVNIRSMFYPNPTPWTSKYFTPVIVFLNYNIMDWLGRFLAGRWLFPRRNHRVLLVICCVLRIGLIPLIMICNQQPRNHLPVVFFHDAAPIIFILLLGLTNGYFVTISMIHAPSYVSTENLEAAGVAMALYGTIGLSLGVAISAGLVPLL